MNIRRIVGRVARTLLTGFLTIAFVAASEVEVQAMARGVEGNYTGLAVSGLGFAILVFLVVVTLCQMTMPTSTTTRRHG